MQFEVAAIGDGAAEGPQDAVGLLTAIRNRVFEIAGATLGWEAGAVAARAWTDQIEDRVCIFCENRFAFDDNGNPKIVSIGYFGHHFCLNIQNSVKSWMSRVSPDWLPDSSKPREAEPASPFFLGGYPYLLVAMTKHPSTLAVEISIAGIPFSKNVTSSAGIIIDRAEDFLRRSSYNSSKWEKKRQELIEIAPCVPDVTEQFDMELFETAIRLTDATQTSTAYKIYYSVGAPEIRPKGANLLIIFDDAGGNAECGLSVPKSNSNPRIFLKKIDWTIQVNSSREHWSKWMEYIVLALRKPKEGQ